MSDINCFGKEEVYGEVLPHWYLVRLIVDKPNNRPYMVNGLFEMKDKSWGLTYMNDPSFLFDIDPMEDNIDNLGELDPDPPGYWEMLNHYRERLVGPCETSYQLVQAAIESGYNLDEGGLACYISHKMWELLEKCNWTPKTTWT